jgi:hypothetical protein
LLRQVSSGQPPGRRLDVVVVEDVVLWRHDPNTLIADVYLANEAALLTACRLVGHGFQGSIVAPIGEARREPGRMIDVIRFASQIQTPRSSIEISEFFVVEMGKEPSTCTTTASAQHKNRRTTSNTNYFSAKGLPAFYS